MDNLVITIIIIVGLLLSFVTGFFTALKSVSLGLKWQIGIKEGKEPTLNNPIEKVVDNIQAANLQRQVDAMNREQERINKEWMFGKEGE